MPIYEYECRHCGSFEHSQSIHDRPLERCPKCRRKVQRLISATSFTLKGGGWYSDGYQKKSATSSDASDAKPSESKTAETKPSDSTGGAKKKAKAEKATKKKASSAGSASSSD